MSHLQTFNNGQFGQVRIVMREQEPWFVAKDIADCIEHKDPTTMVRMCREKDLIVSSATNFDSALLAESGNARIVLVSESGLYRILAKSTLPKCEPFEAWVFDEVLPAIRKHGVYATEDFVTRSLEDPEWAISVLQTLKQEREQRKLAEAQRDEAIRTKAQISSRREATAMNTAAQKSKECERLKERLGEAENWKQIKAIRWLKDYFELNQGLYLAVARRLTSICAELGLERRDVPDSQYGTVKAYPGEAIERFRIYVESDPLMLSKYRKFKQQPMEVRP